MYIALERMFRTVFLLIASSLGGVVASTSFGCGMFLLVYTPAPRETVSCALPFMWLFGFHAAVFLALIFGFPAALLFRRLGYAKWWQFALGGIFIALPFWTAYFWPFNHGIWFAIWHYNSVQFFGAGGIGGVLFWWLSVRAAERSNKPLHPSAFGAG